MKYKSVNSLLILGLCSLLFYACSFKNNNERTPVSYVNPYIGNISHLLVPTYPTVHLPNSMLRVYPERKDFTSDQINGLPVAVTSHRGSSAFNISPYQGDLKGMKPVISYSYDMEKITPYRYSVYLDETEISIDYAPSHKSAVYKLNFTRAEVPYLIINVGNGSLKVTDQGAITGYQIIDNSNTRIYLYLETKQKTEVVGALKGGTFVQNTKIINGQNEALVLKSENRDIINLRYGISFISVEQARKNLEQEIKTYDVNTIAKAGFDKWNEVLGKIEVVGNENDKVIFYTSLYRTYERMIKISENGQYFSAFTGKVHSDEGIPFYTDDWVWDTYRATHPLRILIEPEKEEAMITSYIRMAKQTKEGWMPTFPEVTGDSHRMNGNHAVAVIWDAYCKGLNGFDLETAYMACKGALTKKSLLPWTRVPNTELDEFYTEKGYFPALKEGQAEYVEEVHSHEKRQPVAITLGACYDDWCLAQIAKKLGKEDDYKYFLKRSYNYRNIYNNETAFFHPKDIEGNFIQPFDYRYSGGMGARDYYDENNGWVYRWDVPHNPADLIKLMGSREKFIENLDQTFREPLGKSKYEFYSQLPDHTGNVGQFSMANEPSLHVPYFYNYAGQPWKTQKRIRELLDQWFRNDLMGVPGDEDGGGMTAFVVFSSMGFYPVTPGSPTYNIGSPRFKYVKIHLGKGKIFEIESINYSSQNKYIQSASLNGKDWNKPWFEHKDIKDGGKLILVMGNKANKKWGASPDCVPPSAEKID